VLNEKTFDSWLYEITTLSYLDSLKSDFGEYMILKSSNFDKWEKSDRYYYGVKKVNDISFVPIVEIEEEGNVQMYDITVPEYHNFVANNIIAHNTSKFCNLAWNLGTYNNDVIPIILTIDDSAKELVPRLVTYDMAMRNKDDNRDLFDLININKVATPFLFKDNLEYDAIMSEREISYQNLFKLTREGRLVVLDREHGSSIDFINSTVKHYAEMHPEKRVILFLDNFHLVDVPGLEDGRIKYKTLSKDLKQVCTTYGATIFTTAEYRKLVKGTKPTNSDLAETVALEYDSNAILHLYSELHDMRDASCKYIMDHNGNKLPIIEEDFGKNKINSFKGTIYYQFIPEKAMYQEVTERHAKNLEMANQQAHQSALMEAQAEEEYNQRGPINSFGANE
jgi:hypothetical protein